MRLSRGYGAGADGELRGTADRVERSGRRRLVSHQLAIAFLLLTPCAAFAICDSAVFHDGFESGDTQRWSNSPDPPRADGTWTFTLNFAGSERRFALELVQRDGGDLVGYLLGGTRFRTLVRGALAGSTLELELELANPAATRTILFTGTLGRETVSGAVSGDIAPQPVALVRAACELVEQQLVAAEFTGDPEPQHLRWLAVVRDAGGAFVSGSFVGETDCALWACDGGLTSFTEAGDALLVGLEPDGGCSAGSSFSATWDAGSGLYVGSYSFHDCLGTTSGSLGAAFGMGTSGTAVRELLAGRAAIADGLESGVPFAVPLPGVSPAFLNFGRDEPGLRAELNDEVLRYTAIEVELGRCRELATTVHPRALPDLVRPFGLKVDEHRSGLPAGDDPPRVVYLDSATRPLLDDLKRVGFESGRWKFTGNQIPGIDLPWSYSVPPGGSRLLAPTADGNPVYVALGPFGAHFQPVTGHPYGAARTNSVGFLVAGDTDMEELEGDGDGIREPGEVWGYPIGVDPTGERVRRRRPVYVAPLAGEIHAVVYRAGPTGVYFDDEPHWTVDLVMGGELQFSLGHVGRIAPELRALVLAATGIDTDSFAGPPGTDLLAGHLPLPIGAGVGLALPQIFADPVPGHPGYFVGGGSFSEYPWAQMEFDVPLTLGEGGALSGQFCVYRFMPRSRRLELRAVMEADMLDPDSLRYRDRFFTRRWQWTAEGALCLAESDLPRDFSSLYTLIGGWFERPEPGTLADEIFAFVPIDRSATAYDPANYDSPAVTHLVTRGAGGLSFWWPMPDGTTATPYLPSGELLEQTDSAMLVKWRELNLTNPIAYQRAVYLLDPAGLKIEWGNFAASPAGAIPPTLLPGDPCDNATVLCYAHEGTWPLP